ncbi:stage II sporulation protein M [Thermococcus sp. MV5]|uniref:stage II sporulation protein M n=1 Tax=Thermococcus sp. MV5 TaxID=1638272 RepID=UPI00143BAB61|nr:stage II sporulation protein M [Thermococcus sp. MV5]NJE26385.1 stage II sporulation protein M [Thermococcus sp. MV5]
MLNRVWRVAIVFLKHRFVLLFSILLFFLGFLFGLKISNTTHKSPPVLKETDIELALGILKQGFIQNSLTFGDLTFLDIVVNDVNLGMLFYEALSLNDIKTFFLLILPHGVFEIPGLIIADAAGFKIPYELLRFALGKKEGIMSEEDAKEFFKLVGISILLIFIAAVIESMITLRLAMWMS